MVQANLSDKEDVKRALENADIVYAVTNFWDPEIVGKDITLEVKQGKILADAAKENQVSWLLWSSLPNVTKQSNGKFQHVHHFSGKLSELISLHLFFLTYLTTEFSLLAMNRKERC
jgi:NmrA-like family